MVWGCMEANHQDAAAATVRHWEAAAAEAEAPSVAVESSSSPLHLLHPSTETDDGDDVAGSWHHFVAVLAVAVLEFPFHPSQLLAAEGVLANSPGWVSVE